MDQAAALAKRAYLSDANQSAEVAKCRQQLLALLRELAAPLQLQDPDKTGTGQLSKAFSAQSSHA